VDSADRSAPGPVVFVTGGGRGIGRAIALAFAAPGATIAIASRSAAQLDETASEIRGRGAEAIALTMDVTDARAVSEAFTRLAGRVARVDVLVNNAGVGGGQPVPGSDEAAWRRIIDTNVVGTYLVTRAALPLIPEGGRVINMSSVLGRFGVPGYTAYCASKHAVVGFTRALALELAPRAITVNALCPGWVDTDMAVEGMTLGAQAMGTTYDDFRRRALRAVPIKRIIQPEEVARLVKFLASPDSSAITGQTYNICGGQIMS
jgi:NAD(P)-dependent dehydrogenase (short-subunit alcohol dehydrogenase family)